MTRLHDKAAWQSCMTMPNGPPNTLPGRQIIVIKQCDY